TQAPLPAYWVANAGLSAQWRGFEAFVTLNNLLNNKYETFGTFAPDARLPGTPVVPFVTPAPPINVLAGLRYSFYVPGAARVRSSGAPAAGAAPAPRRARSGRSARDRRARSARADRRGAGRSAPADRDRSSARRR